MTVTDETLGGAHALAVDDVAGRLGTDIDDGLTAVEAATRLDRFGPNALSESATEPVWKAVLRQYRDFMQLLLLGAGVVSLVIGEASTGVLLFVLTVVNAWLGYRQEAKAEAAVAALQDMMQVTARVRRDGRIVELDARQLVPGDLVQIEAGDLVPADGRIVRAATLEIEESALTGESQPSAKDPAAVPGTEVALGDRHDMAYMNTQVTRGTGAFVVTATGMATEMGRIAGMLDEVDVELSPLQRQMNQLARVFAYLAGATIVLMLVAGGARGLNRNDLFLLAITVAIGAIPTGLPIVVTSLLSIGTRQLADQHAVVKDLTSVETLGSTSAICSDKTGTLTLNQMTVRAIRTAGGEFTVEGQGYEPVGAILRPAGVAAEVLDLPLTAMALCSDATVTDGALIGDPTEGAVVAVAGKGGIDVGATRDRYPRLAELPFDSEYKLMATFHDWTDEAGQPVVRCFVKGAPDVILGRSSSARGPEGDVSIDVARDLVDATNRTFAEQGLRVLAVACRDFDPASFDPQADLLGLVDELRLLALFGIVDPPRAEARDAIAVAKRAGIRVRMITGDHAVTAAAIAGELGIEGRAVTGADLDHLDDETFLAEVDEIGVFGRVAPEHKVRLVRTLKQRGEIVAMTGDGVNDAPALKSADIGIAMGITGTEVSKQAARMILTDDNFATIVKAVEAGRVIYDNLLKYIRFQTASLVAFVAAFVGATLFNIAQGAPLNPLQLLWISFVIIAPLAIALGFDTTGADLMDRPPRDPVKPVLDRSRWVRLTILGLTMAVVTLAATVLAPDDAQLDTASVAGTMAFVVMSLSCILCALCSRDERGSVLRSDPFGNPRLLRSLAITAVLTILSTELGFLQRWLLTESLTARQWGACLLAVVIVVVVDEVRKGVERRTAHRGDAPVPT
jgi:Ca2+-transporting ATPase